MVTELLRCPFCGGEAKLVKRILFDASARVKCTRCFASTFEYTQMNLDDAVYLATTAWNRRENSNEHIN